MQRCSGQGALRVVRSHSGTIALITHPAGPLPHATDEPLVFLPSQAPTVVTSSPTRSPTSPTVRPTTYPTVAPSTVSCHIHHSLQSPELSRLRPWPLRVGVTCWWYGLAHHDRSRPPRPRLVQLWPRPRPPPRAPAPHLPSPQVPLPHSRRPPLQHM